jgi:alpha-ketoglutarate-dependent taurine dioxygenase
LRTDIAAGSGVNDLVVTKRHDLIGAEIRGIDLAQRIDDATIAAIDRAWLENLVLVFPDQPITDEQQIAFARRFGELEIHPAKDHRSSRHPEIFRVSNVDESGQILKQDSEALSYINVTWLWHADSSFRQTPSKGSILHGIEVSPEGGETLFCNLYAVYAALPEDMKRRVGALHALHSHDTVLEKHKKLTDPGRFDKYDARHPLVCRLPVTKRPFLFLSPHTMAGIEGMSPNESRPLLEELVQFATQDRFVYRHTWRKDDVIMWDNRCTMHAVTPFDNARLRRIMHRTTLAGETPVLAA